MHFIAVTITIYKRRVKRKESGESNSYDEYKICTFIRRSHTPYQSLNKVDQIALV